MQDSLLYLDSLDILIFFGFKDTFQFIVSLSFTSGSQNSAVFFWDHNIISVTLNSSACKINKIK